MDDKKKNRIIKLVLLLLSLSFAGVIVDIGSVIFRSLHTKLFDVHYLNIFHINGLDFTLYIPTWPVLLLIGTLIFYLICLRFLYRIMRKCLKAQIKH